MFPKGASTHHYDDKLTPPTVAGFLLDNVIPGVGRLESRGCVGLFPNLHRFHDVCCLLFSL